MYAVFQTGGKQFRAEPGVRLRVPTLDVEPGASVVFDQVLLASDGEQTVQVGAPTVAGASVTAEVLRHGREKKIIVFKRKRRKGYRKKQGHRQDFTEIRVDQVALA
jgi:large subunit ribosomal protein L21